MSYEGYTEKRKLSNKNYMDKLERVVLWCKPEEKKAIKEAAKANDKSMNDFVLSKIFPDRVVKAKGGAKNEGEANN